MTTLINIKTGRKQECNLKTFTTPGDTIVLDNDPSKIYIVVNSSPPLKTMPYVWSVLSPVQYTTIGVTFPSSAKIYHYFAPKHKYEIGDKVEVTTPYGTSTVTVREVNVSISNSRATRILTTKFTDKEENKDMNINTNKLFKIFEFGKVRTDAIKFSINGLAFKREDGAYVTYNAENHEFLDVSAFVIDTDFIFAMPVALKDLKKGDIIKHINRYVVVDGIFEEDGTIKAIDPLAGEEKVIIPIKNIFGFNYYTKIVNIFEGFTSTPTEDNPFGNMIPFMFADGGFDSTMMLAMMMQNSDMSADFTKNPFMMMMLLNK